jgi:2-polyprenyl-3-methyl-5-hydroxy-6-metoxy-1,4-benzoquinol methylase
MQRSFDSEILDGDGVPPDVVARAHRGLRLTHTLLGNRAAILRALRRDGPPIRRVLDVGCGHGAMLTDIQARLGVDVIGADLKPPADSPVTIVRADVTRDPLPEADVAISICLVHHLTDEQVVALIRNVGRSCRRFIILDLVRSRIPLTLFRIAAPLVLPPVNVSDGALSIRRAFTPVEFRALVGRALGDRPFRHTVAPLSIRQMADITF